MTPRCLFARRRNDDLGVGRRVRERAEAITAELRRKHGGLSLAVDGIRETRDVCQVETRHALTRAERPKRIPARAGWPLWKASLADSPDFHPHHPLLDRAYRVAVDPTRIRAGIKRVQIGWRGGQSSEPFPTCGLTVPWNRRKPRKRGKPRNGCKRRKETGLCLSPVSTDRRPRRGGRGCVKLAGAMQRMLRSPVPKICLIHDPVDGVRGALLQPAPCAAARPPRPTECGGVAGNSVRAAQAAEGIAVAPTKLPATGVGGQLARWHATHAGTESTHRTRSTGS
jgi:hypothetical protein